MIMPLSPLIKSESYVGIFVQKPVYTISLNQSINRSTNQSIHLYIMKFKL